jgi:hypothetical protein
LSFYAPVTQTYYLVVDSTNAHGLGDFTVTVDIHANDTCQPGGSSCDAQTGTLSVCDDAGSALRATATCAWGCDGPRCAAPPTANDTCAQAELITESTRILDSFDRFSNQHTPPDGICTVFTPLAPDAVYAVELQAGESLVATVSGTPGAMAYVLDTCQDDSQCLAAARRVDGDNYGTGYVASSNRTVYLVVDAISENKTGDFVLDVDIAPQQCQPGAEICDGSTTKKVCNDYGRWEVTECPFGCYAGACHPGPNDSCATAQQTGGGSFSASFDAYTNQHDPALAPPSCTGDAAAGPEAVYFVDAQKNEVIRASVRSQENVAVWISTNCATPHAFCTAGADETRAQPEMVEFVVPEDGRYYIFADSYDPAATGEFRVDIAVDPPACGAGASTCIDNATLSYCSNDGTGWVDYACDGGCMDGACTQPSGDVCADAAPLTGTTTVTGDFGALTNALDPGYGGCTGYDALGPDAAYVVTLAAGQTLTATLRNTALSEDLSLYVLSDCTDAKNACVAGSDVYGAADETVTYTATADETVYVVADSYDMAVGVFELEVMVQ